MSVTEYVEAKQVHEFCHDYQSFIITWKFYILSICNLNQALHSHLTALNTRMIIVVQYCCGAILLDPRVGTFLEEENKEEEED